MVNWRRVLFFVVLFTVWYCWPTEGGQDKQKKEEVITIMVTPRLVVPNPNKRTTFHIVWRIARHPDNRLWSLAYGCESGETNGSWQSMDGEDEPITHDIYRDILVGGGCNFEVCVYRGIGKPFKCANQSVMAPKQGED